MKLHLYQVDAFADKVFEGNPAGVCILDEWLDDSLMQRIAMENNLAETAFAVKSEVGYELRWFTPEVEVDLCGHATLAMAHVIFEHLNSDAAELCFSTRQSGLLYVRRDGDELVLDFPADRPELVDMHPVLSVSLSREPLETYRGKTDYMLVYKNQSQIEGMTPNFLLMSQVKARGIIVTAPGDSVDFVSRFFGPAVGINEDPVTGSAHTLLTPYWARVLGKDVMRARQVSPRGGNLGVVLDGKRVRMSGRAVTYLSGEINI